MENKPKIRLIFFHFNETKFYINSYKLSFDKNIHNIDSSDIIYDIPDDIFKYGKTKRKVSIELFDSSKELLETINFNVHYGLNNIYIGQEGFGKGFNFEMVFKNFKDLKVSNDGKEFTEFDSFNTKNRKKITILNYRCSDICVNDKVIDLIKATKINSDFYQFSINIEDFRLIVQPNQEIKKLEFNLLMNKKKLLNSFYKDIQDLIKNELNFNNNYHTIVNYYKKKIHQIYFGLNMPKPFLDEYFKDNNIELDIIYKYLLYVVFTRGKRKYSKNINLWKNTFNKYLNFFNEIIGTKLKIYEKICLLDRIGDLFFLCPDMESLNNINIKYIILSDIQKDSIIDKSRKYYDNFVSKLSENSKIFNYILNIDSGIGFYNGEEIYTFDMTNLENIKIHLNELFPTVLLFYYFKDDILANTKKGVPCIAINKYFFFKENSSYEESLEKSIEGKNVDIINDMAINLFVLLLHEVMGHNKFSYNNNFDDSPKKIINENNELIELKKFCDYTFNESDKEYILGNSCHKKGDSGTYLELAFGKFGRRLITSLMLNIKDKSKLITRVDLFTDENLEKLRKYVILKTISNEKKLDIKEIKEKSTIEEEITIYEKYIDYKNLTEEKEEKKDNNEDKGGNEDENIVKMIGKKTKRTADKKSDDEDSNTESNKKNKNDIINFDNKNNIYDTEENNMEERSEDSDSNYSNITDNDELFEKLYKKILRKYNFKEDCSIIEKIYEKLKDESITPDEKEDLWYVLEYKLIVN